MTSTAKIADLLLRWEELRRQGKTVSPQELCRDCPELVAGVQQQIAVLEAVNRVLENTEGKADLGKKEIKPRTRYDDLKPGQEPVAGYKLVGRLGKGGFGEVWKAIGPGGFPVALKFISMAGKLPASEIKALEIVKHLRHPHLLSTFGSWQIPGFLVVGMELADRTLYQLFQDAISKGLPGIPQAELVEFMYQAAQGIDFLNAPQHEIDGIKGVALQHRDIKPQNILLVGNGAKVADFGLIRVVQHTMTSHTGSLTVAYAAPEFFNGQTSHSSDQYSLAVTCCQLRGGRLPFEGTPVQVMAGHIGKPPDLSMLPPEERAVLAKALAKKPADRWPSCVAFVEALRLCRLPVGIAHKNRRRAIFWTLGLAGIITLVLSCFVLFFRPSDPREIVYLATLQEQNVKVENKWFRKNGMVDDGNDEYPIVVDGTKSVHGIFMHPESKSFSTVSYTLDETCSGFLASAAIPQSKPDQQDPATALTFLVVGDGKILWKSRPLEKIGQSQSCEVPLQGIKNLELRVDCPGSNNYAWATWLEPRIVLRKGSIPRPKKEDAGFRKVYLTQMNEYDVIRGPWPIGKGEFGNGSPIVVDGRIKGHSLGMHPPHNGYSRAKYHLRESASFFIGSAALLGTLGKRSKTPVTFQVLSQKRTLWRSQPVQKESEFQHFKLDIAGLNELELRVNCPGRYDGAHAVWLEPYILENDSVPPTKK